MFFKKFLLSLFILSAVSNASAGFLEDLSSKDIQNYGKAGLLVGSALVLHSCIRKMDGDNYLEKASSFAGKVAELGIGTAVFVASGICLVESDQIVSEIARRNSRCV